MELVVEYVFSDYRLKDLSKINIVLGKNGCGKSTLLKQADSQLASADIGKKKYVTPERGGVLTYEAGIDQNITANLTWLAESRRVNQFAQFKQQSAVQFRRLELLVLREAEAKAAVADFAPYVEKLNTLLDNIELRRIDPTFKLFSRATGTEIPPQNISSGESELIALGIEILIFAKERESGKDNLLILDEPDVHLHPDLQARLVEFIARTVDEGDTRVLVATHSTAMLGGLSSRSDATVAFMRAGDKELQFVLVSDIYRAVLPVFGAHPLSNIFNESPILVVEGEDDERIWQQAVRSSGGTLSLYPVSCEGVSAIGTYEKEVDSIVQCVYDDGVAYSLRDGDGATGDIDNLGAVRRLRLQCYAAENLMLTDEVLGSLGLTFNDVQAHADTWLVANTSHSRWQAMTDFKSSGYDRKLFNLKDLRMVIAGQILGTNKPWEVLIGQVLANYKPVSAGSLVLAGSLEDFLGSKLVNELFERP